jgi:hypothetical protein
MDWADYSCASMQKTKKPPHQKTNPEKEQNIFLNLLLKAD